jgi:hypothetical protein
MADIRFTIDVAGHPRSLFSITERKDEVTLGLKSPLIVNKDGKAPSPIETPDVEPSQIREQRFSIHPSPNSPMRITAIKQTRILANGRRDYLRHYTRAIKDGEKFALIFSRRCGRLESPEYIPKGKFTNISLGAFEPDNFSLIYSVIVAANGLNFSPDFDLYEKGISIKQVPLKNFQIVVLWTFINIRAQPTTFSTFELTFRPPPRKSTSTWPEKRRKTRP